MKLQPSPQSRASARRACYGGLRWSRPSRSQHLPQSRHWKPGGTTHARRTNRIALATRQGVRHGDRQPAPSLRVELEVREASENIQAESDSLSRFLAALVHEGTKRRYMRAKFIARGAAARDESRSSGDYVDTVEVLDKPQCRMDADRALRASQVRLTHVANPERLYGFLPKRGRNGSPAIKRRPPFTPTSRLTKRRR